MFASSLVIVSGLTNAWRTIAGTTPGWTVRPLDRPTDTRAWRRRFIAATKTWLMHVVTCSCKSFNFYRSCDVGVMTVDYWQADRGADQNDRAASWRTTVWWSQTEQRRRRTNRRLSVPGTTCSLVPRHIILTQREQWQITGMCNR